MAAPQIKAGDVLDRKYRVERVLGTGGMGVVVACRHVQLGQRVALKFMLKEAMADPSNAERFAREARSAVRLQSPHTARVLDVGKLKNGEPYMVMEYLDGKDLDEVVRTNGPLPPHVAIDFILQACEAFAEAHGLGMIHRDIKPKNLFLAQTVDGRPLVKVLDFGLAKTIGAMGDVSLTATSAVFGSPQYMSPEQMRSAKDVDTRSDIWSIGVCLYELLTTRVPFDAGGVAEICAMVLKDPVEPPSKWAIGLPPDLDAVVVKCLAKDPNDRYQSVAELAFALEPWAAIEGSAKRILHVMQTVQKTDLPTMMNVDADVAGHGGGPKTMAAWDSGERTRLTANGLPRAAWAAFGVAGFLGLVGLAAIVSSRVHKPAHPIAAASAASSALAGDPPPAALTPVPVIAAVPSSASASASATAAATNAAVDTPPRSDPPSSDPSPALTSTLAATAGARPPPVIKPPTVKAPPTARPGTTTTTARPPRPPGSKPDPAAYP